MGTETKQKKSVENAIERKGEDKLNKQHTFEDTQINAKAEPQSNKIDSSQKHFENQDIKKKDEKKQKSFDKEVPKQTDTSVPKTSPQEPEKKTSNFKKPVEKPQEENKKDTNRDEPTPVSEKAKTEKPDKTRFENQTARPEDKHVTINENISKNVENEPKRVEPIKKLSHSISREDEKIQVKQGEIQRKTIENKDELQKEVLTKENISPMLSDNKEADVNSQRVRMVKKKKKKARSDSEIETIQFDQLNDDGVKQSESDEIVTEQKYTVQEPESPAAPLLGKKVPHHDHAQRNIEVCEISPEGIEQPKSWPTGEKSQNDLIPTIMEPKPKEDDGKIDVQLKHVEQTRKENIPEIRLTEDYDLKPTPKQSPKLPEQSLESVRLKQTKHTTTHDTNIARVEREAMGEVFEAVENWL